MKLPSVFLFALSALCLSIGLSAQEEPQQPPPPPEQAEYAAARQIAALPERIKELQRLKATYPDSVFGFDFDMALLNAVSKNAGSLDELLAAQKEVINASSNVRGRGLVPSGGGLFGMDRFALIASSVNLLMEHKKIDSFSKPDFLKAIQGYMAEGNQLLADPAYLDYIPENHRRSVLRNYRVVFYMPLAKAQLMNGNGQAALDTLNEYKTVGSINANYYNTLGDAYLALKRDKDALDIFFTATRESNNNAAIGKARSVYTKIHGKADGFEAELEKYQAKLPFHPSPFAAPAEWKGKAVLAELFTGAGCGPCVAADYAFDGLLETYPAQYLAILEYHLPIPLPDPMMNPTTKMRQDYYGKDIGGTPTVFIDGVTKVNTGGAIATAAVSFTRLKNAIDPILGSEIKLTIKATAALDGDVVQVDCEFSGVIEGADYNVALVQTEEKYKGENGLLFHKMVVRDMKALKPATKASAVFNIPESEKATKTYLTEFKGRRRNMRYPEDRNLIDRGKLRAVVFVQNKGTRQVYNAFVADVKLSD
jgi:hypothetical protein